MATKKTSVKRQLPSSSLKEFEQDLSERYGKDKIKKISKLKHSDRYEAFGLLASCNDSNSHKVVDDILGKSVDFENSFYSSLESKILSARDKETIKCQKGAFKCKNPDCKSDECYFFVRQTRSADEGSTVFIVCTKCKRMRKE